MAQLPRRLALDLTRRGAGPEPLPGRAARCAGALLLASALLAAPARGADLIGTWHVLVHYTDAGSAAPSRLRWSDRVWVFERRGPELVWTEYPIVVFGDRTGRFERSRSGGLARVPGAWEPTEGQLADIAAGLRIDSRGSRRKSLRGTDEQGWRSTARARMTSASVITYQESWSIQGWRDLPVFEQRDVMSSARAETLEGITRFETTAVEPGGDALRGRFQRDATRRGTFTMRRSGEVGRLERPAAGTRASP